MSDLFQAQQGWTAWDNLGNTERKEHTMTMTLTEALAYWDALATERDRIARLYAEASGDAEGDATMYDADEAQSAYEVDAAERGELLADAVRAHLEGAQS